jgi:hypothetical protein
VSGSPACFEERPGWFELPHLIVRRRMMLNIKELAEKGA